MQLFIFLLWLFTGFTAADPPNIFLSTDHGDSWQPFADGLPEGAAAGAMIEHEGRLLLGTDAHGFYVRPAGSEGWEARNQGLPERIDINSVAAKGDFIVIGTFHGRIYTSRNGGKNWQRFVFSFMGGSVRALHFHGDILIAGTDNGIYRSFDYGTTWRREGDLIQVNDLAAYDGALYAARRDGITVSHDDGASWSIVYPEQTVSRLLLTKDRLYALEMGGRVLRSKDGRFWERPVMAIPGAARRNLPAALWGGFKPQSPVEMPVRSITETSLGWVMGVAGGC